ncbi:enoyl-CoA hydratase/isomerase family protein [Maricaulis sp.]|uniref:enoyl-CoA hydratase/isomerase family protein n=1 Tax=Maricaulis sp. TaxID=1486257 RepID=UPI00260CF5F3|nr:enoyl-CoA hydratase/isomerase family protein [Maricaulis sp.]
MTETLEHPPLISHFDHDVLTLQLNRPGRANSLTPELLETGLNALHEHSDAHTIVLTGAGRAFSAGGDLGGFLEHAETTEALLGYSDRLVGLLNAFILALVESEGLVLAAVNGPVTGGSLGLVLAADHAVFAETAFVQPYYGQIGFAPDGGWTAMLPDVIGAAQTRNWIATDVRYDAITALHIGLAHEVAAADEFGTTVREAMERLAVMDRAVIQASRRMLNADRDALENKLEREKRAFLDLIARPSTLSRMRAFAGGKHRDSDTLREVHSDDH